MPKTPLFKIKSVHRWMEEEGLSDFLLCKAVDEIDAGLVDAALGGDVYKKRIALPGRGKRGGARTLLIFKSGLRACFIYGFSKNQRDNVTPLELRALKRYARELLGYSDQELARALAAGEMIEVRCNE